jgi:hypothetical protein
VDFIDGDDDSMPRRASSVATDALDGADGPAIVSPSAPRSPM